MSKADQQSLLVSKIKNIAERVARMSLSVKELKALDKSLEGLEVLLDTAAQAEASRSSTPSGSKSEQVAFSLDGEIEIWCDGSCSPNPGPGGWGAIVDQGGAREELSGGVFSATNNIMEMTAAIEALAKTPTQAKVHITTDSRYLIDGITKWIHDWKKRGWRKADKKPVLNVAFWKQLDDLVGKRNVTWSWVRGHSGHPENERCDQLANEARKGLESD